MLAHRFPITHLPQKLEEHHQTTERGDRSLRLAQFLFFSAPKSGNFPVHCFVLLGVSFIQLKLNRVRAKQCYSISEFRINAATVECFVSLKFSWHSRAHTSKGGHLPALNQQETLQAFSLLSPPALF